MTRKAYDQELDALKQDILRMGSMVEEAVYLAITALTQQDVELASRVITSDRYVNVLEPAIEERCLNLLALQQPLAGDLRMVATAIWIITDLERIADHAVNISEISVRIGKQPLVKALVDIPRMARIAEKMINKCLDAFVSRDVKLARNTCRTDDVVDEIYKALFNELMEIIITSSDTNISTQAANLLFVARFLERIADHATNIGERVIYMITGLRESY
jgi:phosphate transport system protein